MNFSTVRYLKFPRLMKKLEKTLLLKKCQKYGIIEAVNERGGAWFNGIQLSG